MLHTRRELEKYSIEAIDGEIGHVKHFYFDDDSCVVRYLVVDVGSWLTRRRVLVSPVSIHEENWIERTPLFANTKNQFRHSPDIDTNQPVSRQNEERYLGDYDYPNYWGDAGMWGVGTCPYADFPGCVGSDIERVNRAELEHDIEARQRAERARYCHSGPHWLNCNSVVGYHLHAADGDIGRVSGHRIDEETWGILYLVVDRSSWWMGHKVLIAPEWVNGVHWSYKTVCVNVNRESVKTALAHDPESVWTDDLGPYQHCGREGYWSGIFGTAGVT